MTIATPPISTEPAKATCFAPRNDDFVPGEDWFARPRPAFGAESVDLLAGPLRFRLNGMSASQALHLRRRFRPYVETSARPPAADITLRLTRAGVLEFLSLPAGREEIYRMGRRTRPGARDVWSYEFAGTVSASDRVADLALVSESGALFERGVENYLRTLAASLILERGGLLLHASGVVRGGRAYVFFGPSGSGKTTVTLLSRDATILGDDLALVLPGTDGFRVAGMPFGLAHHHVPESGAAFPIASLLRLVQSPDVRRQPLRGAAALAELATCLPFVMQETTDAARALDIGGRLLEKVPAWRLFFRKDDSFWDVIEDS